MTAGCMACSDGISTEEYLSRIEIKLSWELHTKNGVKNVTISQVLCLPQSIRLPL